LSPIIRYVKRQCSEKIAKIKLQFQTELEKEWNNIWNCDLQTGEKCGLSKEELKGVSCCVGYHSFDRMLENLTKGNECDQNEINTKCSEALENQKRECPQYDYQSDKCAKLRSIGVSLKLIPCALYLMASLFITFYIF
jgi:hypothetical protein